MEIFPFLLELKLCHFYNQLYKEKVPIVTHFTIKDGENKTMITHPRNEEPLFIYVNEQTLRQNG